MSCCLNPACDQPLNVEGNNYCEHCGTPLSPLLRNRYKIIQPIGRGGFGTTYLAEDVDMLHQVCVVKQLLYQSQGSQTNQKIVELFIREAEQLKQLRDNPQIPNLQAYFKDNQNLYMVQDYIEGQDLLKELKHNGTFSNSQIRHVLVEILPVLHFIHENGVLHRDIKPDNIMRCRKDNKLVLIDFGVAREISMNHLSLMGTIVGSPGYSSVEQFNNGKASAASDLYSLGTTCFHLMTNQHPTDLWTMQGYSWVNNWQQYLPNPFQSDLLGIINKLLQIQVEDRYQTASAVLEDLKHIPHTFNESFLAPNSYLGSAQTSPIPSSLPRSTQQSISPEAAIESSVERESSPQIALTSFKRSRRKFLSLAAFGGVGLGSVLIWEVIRNGAIPTVSSPEEGLDPLSQKPTLEADLSLASELPLNLQNYKFEVVRVDTQGKITNRNYSQAQFISEDLGSGIVLEMVAIYGGTFMMGSTSSELDRDDDEGPQHKVTVPDFYMSKYQITQAQWESIMRTNPSKFTGGNRPVEQVSWNDAVEFCQKLKQKSGKNYRLPSEAEWEYACRAGTTTPFYFGDTITPKLANYAGNIAYGSGPKGEYREQTTDVGTFPANAFGLYDMHGNVYEWCQDIWHETYEGAPTDGSAWINNQNDSRRVIRCGSWYNGPRYSRSASRSRFNPNKRGYGFGFRIALYISKGETQRA